VKKILCCKGIYSSVGVPPIFSLNLIATVIKANIFDCNYPPPTVCWIWWIRIMCAFFIYSLEVENRPSEVAWPKLISAQWNCNFCQLCRSWNINHSFALEISKQLQCKRFWRVCSVTCFILLGPELLFHWVINICLSLWNLPVVLRVKFVWYGDAGRDGTDRYHVIISCSWPLAWISNIWVSLCLNNLIKTCSSVYH
jgi:hypothetical protein